MAANERQVGGKHYARGEKDQHWDVMARLEAGYFVGQITKYTERHASKNGRQDLEKAVHFAEKWLERERAVQAQIDEYTHDMRLDFNVSRVYDSIFGSRVITAQRTLEACRRHLLHCYPEDAGPGTPEDGGQHSRQTSTEEWNEEFLTTLTEKGLLEAIVKFEGLSQKQPLGSVEYREANENRERLRNEVSRRGMFIARDRFGKPESLKVDDSPRVPRQG